MDVCAGTTIRFKGRYAELHRAAAARELDGKCFGDGNELHVTKPGKLPLRIVPRLSPEDVGVLGANGHNEATRVVRFHA